MRKKTLYRAVILISVIVFACIFVTKYTGLNGYRKEIDSLKAEIAAQEKYGKELEETAAEYSSDEFVEQTARDLGFVKPNEKIFKNYNEKK